MKILLLFLPIFLLAQIPSGYYDTIQDQTGDELKTILYNIIKDHTEYPYTSSSTDTWDILKDADEDPNNPENVILIYSGRSVDAEQEYNNGAGWSREHVWAKSRGDFGTSNGAGTDAHHLRACDISVNSARNNRWFDECSEPYYDGSFNTGSFTSSTEWVWKPRDEVKGDVARMMFYMATRYEGDNGEPDLELIDYIPYDQYTNDPIHAKLSTLLLWHTQDSVDINEQRRNDIIYSYQNNRNPFIDHPEYVDLIWGDQSTGVNMDIPEQFEIEPVYPNPTNFTFNIPLNIDEDMNVAVNLFDVTGKKSGNGRYFKLSRGDHRLKVDLNDQNSGVYLVRTVLNNQTNLQRIILLK